MTAKVFTEYFIMTLPYVMAVVFLWGAFFRGMIWYTVRRHEWFARELEKRVNKFVENEQPGEVKDVSFYALSKKMLERTYYEAFAMRDRFRRRRGDSMMMAVDRIFLVKQGCAWFVKDLLKQIKFLKWTEDTPKLLQITKATLHHNPCFTRVFGVLPMAALNDLISILPGLFVVAGILGTFVGIAGGLQELGSMNLTDLENTKNIMDRFLFEISFAMKTSIAGIVFSLAAHIVNVVMSPERVYVSMVDRVESSLDLLWYRSDNNNFPKLERAFDEHKDPMDALAEESVNAEVARHTRGRSLEDVKPNKAS